MKGDCYEAAARFVIGNSRSPGIVLVHGEVTGQTNQRKTVEIHGLSLEEFKLRVAHDTIAVSHGP